MIKVYEVASHIFSHYFAKIKVGSYDSLAMEKLVTLHNAIIHIKSVVNKDKTTPTIRYF